MRQYFAVAGIGCLRAEYDRRTLRTAQNLVEQCQFHLAIARAAQMWTQVGGPESTLLDDLLQGRDEGLPDRVVEIMRFLDNQVNRLAFGANEILDPLELLSPLRVSREVP